jgi:hypothetical protein
MRRLASCLALLLLLAPAAGAADVAITRVFTGWRDAASFKRIAEYFTGREHTGDEIVRRTQPAERAGYYFLARTANPGPARPARFELAVILPRAPEARRHSFPVELPAGKALFNLGLTGADWPGRETDAVAWQLELRAEDGTLLATARSYLWEKPAP